MADQRQKTTPGTNQPTPKDIEDSKALDSSLLEKLYGTNKLTKLPDGTTLVRYYFNSDVEADVLCAGSSIPIKGCEAPSTQVKESALAAMSTIVQQSKAKIKFVETHSHKDADIAFSEISFGWLGRIDKFLLGVDGEVPVGVTEKAYEHAFIAINPDQIRDAAKSLLKGNYTDARSQTFMTRTIEHEIEHRFGAKHGDKKTRDNPRTLEGQVSPDRTIMVIKADEKNLMADEKLGSLDIAWYQRHFGKAELVSHNDIKTPNPIAPPPTDPAKKER